MQPLNEEQRDLAVQSLTRADRIAARYARIFPEHADDLASSAIWGVLKAARTFTDGGAKWENWSANEARNECRRFLRHPDFKRQVVWDEFAPQYEPCAPAPEVVDDMETMLVGLPERHRDLCLKVYREDVTIEDAATSLGFSPKHGHKLHRQALDILRSRMSA